MKFQAVLQLHGKTATGFDVPAAVVESFGKGKRVPVVVTINGYSYRNTIAVYGGDYMLGVAAEHRERAGIAAGDLVDVDVVFDDQPREVDVPADFAAAMDAEPGLRQTFDRLAFTHRKEHVRAIEDAKTEATRTRRIERAIEMLQTKG